ncbi:MAG: hypothetical protein HQL42_17700 [Alphaproteobacteria bacterium]|nr:hypothetical protein [Alphaproteobacteria bacterium]
MFVFVTDLIKRLPKWLFDALPWLVVFGGTLSLALSFFHFPVATAPAWHSFTLTLGSAAIAGGVFGGITKSDHFAAIFRSTMEDIVWSDRFLEVRSDLDNVWVRVSHALSGKRFPDIKEKLNSGLLRHYFPNNRSFYYTKNRRVFNIKGLSDCGKFLKVEQIAEMDLVPHPDAPKVDYRNKYTSSKGGGQVQTHFSVHRHDGDRRVTLGQEELKPYEVNDLPQSDSVKFYGLDLPTAKYTIKRQALHTIVLDEKPYLKFKFNTYSDGTEVTVRGLSSAVKCRFESLGTIEEYVDVLHDENGGTDTIQKEYVGLILPKQGFTLYFMVDRPGPTLGG